MGDKPEEIHGPQEAARRLYLSPSGLRKYAYDLERAAEELWAQLPGGKADRIATPIKGKAGRRLYSDASIGLIEKIKERVRQGDDRLNAARRVLGVQLTEDPDLAASLRGIVREEIRLALQEVRQELAALKERVDNAGADGS